MKSIKVDLNRRDGAGLLLSSVRAASEDLEIGDVVSIYQPGEDLDPTLTAEVVSKDEHGKVRLEVNWPAVILPFPGATVLYRRGRVTSTNPPPLLGQHEQVRQYA